MHPRQTAAKAPATYHARPDNLASTFEEALTIIARMRSNRLQVSDAAVFRRNIKELLENSRLKGRQREYSDAAIRQCEYAVVGLLDESVPKMHNRAFDEWRGKPLQEELWGHALLGEKNFESLRRLMAQQDSEELADVLEVFYLCLLLGFKGRYGVSEGGELDTLCADVRERISRIRQLPDHIAPAWSIPREKASLKPATPLSAAC